MLNNKIKHMESAILLNSNNSPKNNTNSIINFNRNININSNIN